MVRGEGVKDVDVGWEVPVVRDGYVQDFGFVWHAWRDVGGLVGGVDYHLGAGCDVVQEGRTCGICCRGISLSVFCVKVTQCHADQTGRENPIDLVPAERTLEGFVTGGY